MVKIIIAMYILYSTCAANPNTDETQFRQNFTQAVTQTWITSGNTCITNNKPVIENYVEELKKLGYYKEESKPEDLNTRNAVIRFQSDHNLVVDGIWGEKSLEILKKRLLYNSLYYNDEISDAPSEKNWMTLNKTKRILTLYQNKSVIKKYPVAIGNPPSLTPNGKFSIFNKVVNPTWGGGGYAKPVKGGSPKNPLGYRWMGLSIRGGDRYGVHGNNSPYSIGKNVSHGCIRMINSDVEELYTLVPLHTKIWIGTEEQLLEWGISQEEY